MTRDITTIEGVGRKFTTENSNIKQDMPNHAVGAEKKERKKQRSCGEIRAEHTRETRNKGVVERYEQSILGKPETPSRLENE
jgi:hypothetical protein